MSQKISIFGTGYVGLVTGACLAEMGHRVLCVDIDQAKVERLKRGIIPIHEPGLDEIVERNYREGRLAFTTSAEEAVAFGEFQFIAVGTPAGEDGSADMQYVLAVADTIGRLMTEPRIIVDKSTVPVGTADRVKQTVAEALSARNSDIEFHVCSNPEFLKEGAAVNDFMKPDRIIVGTSSARVAERMRVLYAPFSRTHEKLVVMDERSAELTKYAANAMLATKISFMNEMANLAERLGADIEAVRRGIGSDPRIGYQFIYPGCGFGGSCFPKDIKALRHTALEAGMEPAVLDAVDRVNNRQKSVLFEKLAKRFNGELKGRHIAVWGLAFKPNTDDMREAPSRILMEALWQAGATVSAFDPVAMDECRQHYPDHLALRYAENPMDALQDADALAICTEWSAFRSPDFEAMRQRLKAPIVIDGRNLWEPKDMAQLGFHYDCIGRSIAVTAPGDLAAGPGV